MFRLLISRYTVVILCSVRKVNLLTQKPIYSNIVTVSQPYRQTRTLILEDSANPYIAVCSMTPFLYIEWESSF